MYSAFNHHQRPSQTHQQYISTLEYLCAIYNQKGSLTITKHARSDIIDGSIIQSWLWFKYLFSPFIFAWIFEHFRIFQCYCLTETISHFCLKAAAKQTDAGVWHHHQGGHDVMAVQIIWGRWKDFQFISAHRPAAVLLNLANLCGTLTVPIGSFLQRGHTHNKRKPQTF